MANTFLAFDLGSSNCRSFLGQLKNGKLALEEQDRFGNSPVKVSGTWYWDILHIYNQLKEALISYSGESEASLDGIGIDSWGVDFCLLDGEGRLLSNPIHYRDPRTEGMMEKVFRQIPKEVIFQETGIQFIPINTLYQLFALREEGNPILNYCHRLLMIADTFNYWLTGQARGEFSLATTTQLYNPNNREWSSKIFSETNLPQNIMPQVIKPGNKLGILQPSIQEETGLGEIDVYAPVCHDTGSAVVAVPATLVTTNKWGFISCGTWSLLGAELSSPLITEKARNYNFTNEGGLEDTYRLLRNINGLWLLQQCKKSWAESGKEYTYAELAEMAKVATPFYCYLDPDYEDFMTPGDMVEKIEKYCQATGQKPPEKVGQVVRSILEGLSLKYRYLGDKLEELISKELDVFFLVGGGSKNELLCQYTANGLNKRVVAGPAEATVAGNVLTQALSAGELSSLQEIRQVVENSFQLHTYYPEKRKSWEQAYQEFQTLVEEPREKN